MASRAAQERGTWAVTHDNVVKWVQDEVLSATDSDLPLIVGADMNSILDTTLDSVGTATVARKDCLAMTLQQAGCACAFRMAFPQLQVGSRLCPRGANFLVRIMARPTPNLQVAAAGIHWRHGLSSDHAPLLVDVIGAVSHIVPETEGSRFGRGVACPVPWRAFMALASGTDKRWAELQDARAASEARWRRLEGAADSLTLTAPSGSDLVRARLGELCDDYVSSINQVICELVPTRRQTSHPPHQSNRLSRAWVHARCAIHRAGSAASTSVASDTRVFQLALAAAIAWRRARGMHERELPGAEFGRHASGRVSKPPAGRRPRAFWRKALRALLVSSRESWTAMASRLHRQALCYMQRSAMQERREAHRSGDTAKWLRYLLGAPKHSLPAALESPTATTAAEKVAVGGRVLQEQYGTRHWDADSSGILCTSRDPRGRRRGALLPIAEVLPSKRRACEAAWHGRASLQYHPGIAGLLSRLDASERRSLFGRFRKSGPGLSQFKLCAVSHMGIAAQEACIALLNAMLRLQLAPMWLKQGLLVWIDKPSGGLRGLCLMEELLKALDVILVERLEGILSTYPIGTILSSSNVGFQKGRGAGLVLDVAADFWDEARESATIHSHLPWDFRAFFDTIDLAVPDAILQARGVPPDFAGMLVELHGTGASLRAATPWGITAPVLRRVGVPQGGCSAPLLSRLAGEVVSRLVDSHPQPAIVGGSELAQHSYVDDGNAFASGRGGAQVAADALSEGCLATGLGIDCKQGAVFTTGEPGIVTVTHIDADGQASMEDIRMQAFTESTRFLGVTTHFTGGPADSVLQLDRRIRMQLAVSARRHCDIFELRSLVSMYVHSLLVYAADIQQVPWDLATEWDRLIVKAAMGALRAHPSTSPHFVFTPVRYGGLGFQTCTAQVVAHRLRQCLQAFCGDEPQAVIRRGRWEQLSKLFPEQLSSNASSLISRVEFLASDGWYIRDSKELFQGRVLAKLARSDTSWGRGGYQADRGREAAARARYSSLGPLAATVRAGFDQQPSASEAISAAWWQSAIPALSGHCPVTPEEVATATAAALLEAVQDREAEAALFSAPSAAFADAPAAIENENWHGDNDGSCPWVRRLDSGVATQAASSTRAATDGGYSNEVCTAAWAYDTNLPGQAASSEPVDASELRHSWHTRLPKFLGTRLCTVHEGELAALLSCISAAPPHLAVVIGVDRLALIQLVQVLPTRSRTEEVRANCLPLESRLKRLLEMRENSVSAPASIQQVQQLLPSGRAGWPQTTRYPATVLIHTPSHQPGLVNRVPCELLASLNEIVDGKCEDARRVEALPDICKPAGGGRFTVEHMGMTVVGDPAEAVRTRYSEGALLSLTALPVQGLVAFAAEDLWGLELDQWRSVDLPPELTAVVQELHPGYVPGEPVDVHRWVFKLRVGVGGSYQSLARRNSKYRHIAHSIADDNDIDGHMCFLCGHAIGTRWHALLECPMCEAGTEFDVRAEDSRDAMYAFAESCLRVLGEWKLRDYRPGHKRRLLHQRHGRLYPLLSKAAWLLPTLDQGVSAGDADVAIRAAIPKRLVHSICRIPMLDSAAAGARKPAAAMVRAASGKVPSGSEAAGMRSRHGSCEAHGGRRLRFLECHTQPLHAEASR